jgi:hypothetical protein
MAPDRDRILDQLRALPPVERLRVVEQIIREVGAEVTAQPSSGMVEIATDEDDTELDAYWVPIGRNRA